MKNLFIVFCSLFILNACEKDKEDKNDYYIKFSVNSEMVSMGLEETVESAILSKKSNMGLYSITLSGSRGVSNSIGVSRESVLIVVQDNDPLVINKDYEMHDAVLANDIPIARNMFTYINHENKTYNATILRTNNIQTANECTVRFTEINENSIRGVFSATLIDPSNPSVTLPIREGEFYLNLYRVP